MKLEPGTYVYIKFDRNVCMLRCWSIIAGPVYIGEPADSQYFNEILDEHQFISDGKFEAIWTMATLQNL